MGSKGCIQWHHAGVWRGFGFSLFFTVSPGCTLLFPSLRNCFSYPVLVSPLPTSDATSAVWALYLFSSYDSGISFCKLGKLFHISSYIVSGFGAFFPFIEPLLKLWSLGPVNCSAIWYKTMAYVYVSLCRCVWEQVKIITKKLSRIRILVGRAK